MLSDFVPTYNATAYQKLIDKGFLLIGKTNMDEFAIGSTSESSYFGAVKNPYNFEYASEGAAAAVSAKMATAALGSDTGGSIRQSAAFSGVVGIKPTYGRVSRHGLVAHASSLDQIGTLAATVDDAAIILSVISGYDKEDGTSIDKPVAFTPELLSNDISGIKIGVPDEYFADVDSEITANINKQIELLQKAGAVIEKISLKHTEYALPIHYTIAAAEASTNLARFDGIRFGYRSPNASNLNDIYSKSRSEGFGKEVKRRIIFGTFALSSDYYEDYYLKALKGRTLIIKEFEDVFKKVDAIITPVTAAMAYKLGEKTDPLQMYIADALTASANLAGIP
jgi:aspartyl-tRNA(Asn)/glutamyl-tRNA(Gln) amidotransferase subunit A